MRINWLNIGLLLLVATTWGITSVFLRLPDSMSFLIGFCIGIVMGLVAPLAEFKR